MKASELRIGNIVKQGIIESIGSSLIEVSDTIYESEVIEPIQLTEEWLLKFGFRKVYKTCYQYKDFILDDRFIMMDIDITIQLKYVHQLQNLYFALNDKEL